MSHEDRTLLEGGLCLLSDMAHAGACVLAGGIETSGPVVHPGTHRIWTASTPWTPGFHELRPDVSTSFDLSHRVVHLAAGGFDCAVPAGGLPNARRVCVRLADNRRLCLARPGRTIWPSAAHLCSLRTCCDTTA